MFTVLRSSAGAGKTHALVKHYLGHCLAGKEDAYRQVLALTFTNKAAGEMKERVVQTLSALAAGQMTNSAQRDTVEHLMTVCRTDEATLVLRAEKVLAHMLHHWGDVAISTIDAFTRRVVQPFARDLQLEHDLRMTMDEVWYRDRAVEALIAEAGVDPVTTELLSEACRQLLEDERSWDPGAPLRDLSSELGKESSIAPLRSLQQLDPSLVGPLSARLRKETSEFRERVNAMGRGVLRMFDEAIVRPEDLASGRNGPISWFRKLAAFGDDWIEPSATALKVVESGKWHSAKADTATRQAIDRTSLHATAEFNASLALLADGQRNYFVQRAVLRELPTTFALGRLDRHLEEAKRADGVAFFSDLTRRVAEVVQDEPVPYIYERLGERYRHFLIDEFQDTSSLQWQTLLPLIDNALSTGGSTLIVGDAKQAIYRWRNGEVRLFANLPKLFPPPRTRVEHEREATLERNHIAPIPLADNHRSAHTIVSFNGELFEELAQVLSPELRPIYAAHEQHPKRQEPGFVELRELAKEVTGDAALAAQLDFLLDRVRRCVADGFVPGDIAVLVRSKSLGRRAASHLVANGYSVVSPDGLRMSDDPHVEVLIDLLRTLHGGDPTAAARVQQYRAILSATRSGPTNPFEANMALPDPLADVRAWAVQQGSPALRTTITDLLAQLAKALGLHLASDPQLLTLLDEAHTWSSDHGQDIAGFLEHWDRIGGERASVPPADAHAIQVMTVHRSKGLEFPVVIMPNARMASSRTHGERHWIHTGTAVTELERALVREGAALSKAGIPELEEEQRMRTLDDLDLLYVAFTRPKQRLYALVPASRADGISSALLQYIGKKGENGSLSIGENTPPWKKRPTATSNPLAAGPMHTGGTLLNRRGSTPADWDARDPDPYRRSGNAIHELMSRVVIPGDLPMALNDSLASGAITAEDADVLGRTLPSLLQSEALRPYFGEDLRVRNEASIITSDGRTWRPDRMVFDGESVRVLDIKTGVADDRHQEQVERYVRLLRELGYEQVEGALLYVATGELIRVGT
jgi:ATP-dependent exoDNAse (exonuclease V) beta subunit